MTEVLAMRSGINDRIFQIRKEEITICLDQGIQQEDYLDDFRMEIMGILLQLVDKNATPEELKEIGASLLSFRGKVNTEIMRVLMIPQGQGPAPPPTQGCDECDILTQIKDKIESVIDCASADDAAGAGDGDGAADDAAGDGDCMPPQMYFMDIMEVNRMIDDYTEAQFQKLFQSMDEAERAKIEASLTQMKDIREMLEQNIQKLSRTTDDDRIKKVVISGLSDPRDTLDDQIKECLEQCGQSSCEESCGYQESVKVRDLIQKIKEDFEEEGAVFEDVKDEARRSLMNYISGANKELNDIIKKKVENEGELEDCDEEKMTVINQIKGPVWMLINTTIFAEDSSLPITFTDGILPLLNESIENFCSDDGPTPAPVQSGNCKLDEYEKIAEYVEKIDEIIQDKLFKPTEDSAKVEAQLGFLEVKQMFDARVEELFNADVSCPDELNYLKKELMPILNKCMAEFMNGRRQFSEMSRIERIQCTKDLRGEMEARRAMLLQMELDDIQSGGDAPPGEPDSN